MENREALGVAALGGGILALVLAKNPKLITKAMTPIAEGTKKVVQPAFKRTVQNTLIPISYDSAGITTGLKTMAKHPVATAKSIATNTHLASHPVIGKAYMWEWMQKTVGGNRLIKDAVKKYGGKQPPASDKRFWDFWENELGVRNVLLSKGLGTKVSKGMEKFEDVFRVNKGGVSYNRQNPIGRDKYDELVQNARQKLEKDHLLNRGINSTLGNWTLKDMEIGGKTKAVYEDIWDVGLNAPAIAKRAATRTRALTEVKSLIKHPVAYTKGGQLPYLKRTLGDLIEQEKVYGPRSLLDSVMNPVTVRGTLPNKFIQKNWDEINY